MIKPLKVIALCYTFTLTNVKRKNWLMNQWRQLKTSLYKDMET